MKWMKSPELNRKGEYEIHDVPDRKVEGLKAKGWQEIKSEPEKVPVGPASSGKAKSYTKSYAKSKKTG